MHCASTLLYCHYISLHWVSIVELNLFFIFIRFLIRLAKQSKICFYNQIITKFVNILMNKCINVFYWHKEKLKQSHRKQIKLTYVFKTLNISKWNHMISLKIVVSSLKFNTKSLSKSLKKYTRFQTKSLKILYSRVKFRCNMSFIMKINFRLNWLQYNNIIHWEDLWRKRLG